MSIQFGKWNFDGAPASQEYVAEVRKILSAYGPDGGSYYSRGGVNLLYSALHTTKESHLEIQPYISDSGHTIVWDGRLDNRHELVGLLNSSLSVESTDVSIVAAAYQRWGTNSFANLIGDWVLCIWNPEERSLILAKDPIGCRQLSYRLDKDSITWCTVLDPLVLFSGTNIRLDEEYIAGWFSLFPAAHLTPYVGVRSVPPSSFVVITPGTSRTHKYWNFDPEKRIRYRTDAEYEDHFRWIFAQSVRRRLRSDKPILAELSGGMDSSSIVCMADLVIAREASDFPRLDTISYYDDSEPNWNERPYFEKVEAQRGHEGWHIDARSKTLFHLDSEGFSATPASHSRSSEFAKKFASCICAGGYRAILSGTGGDEVTGGVPNPTPELMDLLAGRQVRAVARQLKVWALEKRKPWVHLFFDATREFLPAAMARVPKYMSPAPWLAPAFSERNQEPLTGYPSRIKLWGPLPSFQASQSTLEAVRRQLSCEPLSKDPVIEVRYPYLDRNLLEFLFAVPREQLVRPGQRRSLMRRALLGIVPSEILNRRRKAYVTRSPRAAISSEWTSVVEMTRYLVAASLGIVEADAFRQALDDARRGRGVPIVPLIRTLWLELWLASLKDRGISLENSQDSVSRSELFAKKAVFAQMGA